MVKVSKGMTNGTCEPSNDPNIKNNQKRLKTSIDSCTDEWSVDSNGDVKRLSKERPVSHVSDEGKISSCQIYCNINCNNSKISFKNQFS